MKTVTFKQDQSLTAFQQLIANIYSIPDDRLYSLDAILTQQQRFTMRALKGIRKNDPEKVKLNLLIAFSWLMSVANRLHIDLETEVWQRFPALCSYCANAPCQCKQTKPTTRRKLKAQPYKQPKSLTALQAMFETIYPSSERTMADAGVHLAEEMGEVSEAVHNYQGQHQRKLFDDIKLEMADYVSCIMGVANSSHMNISHELAEMFSNNCHICHKAPCECSFGFVASLKT